MMLYFISVLCLGVATVQSINVDPEVFMNTTMLIRSKGYPVEEHNVHTKDGYILNVQRITGGRTCKTGGCSTKGPVLLQHGLLSCSACWVENLVNESFGFILADAGYDVWLGNNRGNTYGLKHETLDPSQDDFWKFSFDEMAMLDLPATVDYVLHLTAQQQLVYVGHSQGTEIAFAALSLISDLNDKIRLFVAFGPAAYLGHVKSPIRYLRNLTNEEVYTLFGRKDFLPQSSVLTDLVDRECYKTNKLYKMVCENILFILGGYDFSNTNETRIPVYVGQHPAGTSVQNMLHYIQAVNTDKFQMFDFGAIENMKKYNSTTPPQYPLNKIRTQVALFGGTNDWLTTVTDVNHLASELSPKPFYKICEGYNHLDYIWALNAPSELYKDAMSKF